MSVQVNQIFSDNHVVTTIDGDKFGMKEGMLYVFKGDKAVAIFPGFTSVRFVEDL